MNPTAHIVNDVTAGNLERADIETFQGLRRTIPGWSTWNHISFFKAALTRLFSDSKAVPSVLVGGVYHGMDLAIIAFLAQRYWPGQAYRLVGCDLFSAEPCADWPEDKRGMTWERAFGCPPPSMEAAARNCPKAELVKADSVAYMADHGAEFDLIYLDTSHDEQTVRSELTSVLINPAKGLLLAGDDYSGDGGFQGGVARAVDAMLPDHTVLFNRIWFQYLP
jgi:hypothetical protein